MIRNPDDRVVIPERTNHSQSPDDYLPKRRTALVLTGTGTAGAYQAGALRALEEAAVKIDLIAGHGIGVATAMLAAIGGSHLLWTSRRLWASNTPAFYRWRRGMVVAGLAFGIAIAVLFTPVLLVMAAATLSLAAFVVALVRPDAGTRLAAVSASLVQQMFDPAALPTLIPRIAALALLVMMCALGAAWLGRLCATPRERWGRASWSFGAFGAPWTARDLVDAFTSHLSSLIRRPAARAHPTELEASRLYVDVLSENIGQPGFRELLITVHDVDARQDIVLALLTEPHRARFFEQSEGGDVSRREQEAFDLSGVARDYLMDALTGALSLPLATEPHAITFAPESYWRGETHRVSNRPGALLRLLEEVLKAGAQQVIVLSPSSEEMGHPHALTSPRDDIAGRAGDYLAAAEACALRDALIAWRPHFHALFVVQATHNPVGPFDETGSYDQRSQRRQSIAELMARGYEDAYRQFIDPVLGASGDRLAKGVNA